MSNLWSDLVIGSEIIPQEDLPGLTMSLGTLINPEDLSFPVADLNVNQATAASLSLEETDDRPTIPITNLYTPWFWPALIAGTTIFLIITGLWAFYSQYDLPKKEAELSRITREVDEGKKQLGQLPQIKLDNSILLKRKQVLEDIVHRQSHLALILQSIKDYAPKGIQISKLDLSSKNISIYGQAVDFTEVSRLVLNLSTSPFLSKPNIVFAKRDTQDNPKIIQFSVQASTNLSDEQPIASTPSAK
jgi:Tfp pilus assembly protein PilN